MALAEEEGREGIIIETNRKEPQRVSRSRSLRSFKNTGKNDDSIDDLFDFDSDEFEINPTRKLSLLQHVTGMNHKKIIKKSRLQQRVSMSEESSEPTVDREEADPLLHQQRLEGKEQKQRRGKKSASLITAVETKKKITQMILTIEKHTINIPKRASEENINDVLPDSLYTNFHKRMLRHENRMIDQDIIQSENEAERLTLINEKLDMIMWPTILQKVTKINDPTDDDEMTRKRAQTKECIESMLEKFHSMKRRSNGLTGIQKGGKGKKINPFRNWNKIYSKIDRTLLYPEYHSSSDEDEDAMDIDTVRAHRRALREGQCGGSIIVTLNPSIRFAIVAEPLRKPYVVKASPKEKKRWKQQIKNPRPFSYHPELLGQIAVPVRKVKIPFTLSSLPNEDASMSELVEKAKYGEDFSSIPTVASKPGNSNSETIKMDTPIAAPPKVPPTFDISEFAAPKLEEPQSQKLEHTNKTEGRKKKEANMSKLNSFPTSPINKLQVNTASSEKSILAAKKYKENLNPVVLFPKWIP
ncbi:Sas4p NDAI_0A01110 [Naumovozyma dairenensis CBS 421]|uniref:Something about silencing protein 4 domain-containing protein n=1 Tax=Naumovozyma dairenensis (strain ATCC 10597 / BCRC 20456 / CBS 421 / NBRC 0211 / NRRL Y-12639) TaxID=1071378 RepID=G0W381_NAUDC|nr:hypothetical protein NDAI_0A01110 [Naumovozyma dairenensis CBS 421]CCD22269.1 hypothetical protein NDAI_0A01110 [Naumovozyma dairenensis CBS 421]